MKKRFASTYTFLKLPASVIESSSDFPELYFYFQKTKHLVVGAPQVSVATVERMTALETLSRSAPYRVQTIVK